MPAKIASAREALLDLAHRDAARILITPEIDGARVCLKNPQLAFLHSFIAGPFARRAAQSKQALLRACQNKHRNIRHVLDLTAGWGVDAFTLASHGQRVTLLEYQPLIHAIVEYSRVLMAHSDQGAETAGRMNLRQQAAKDYLLSLPPDHDVDCVYIDPMFPAHKSGAKPGKEMQILQAMTENFEMETCFGLALQTARKRVVVKRPARAVSFGEASPDLVYREKTVRFDVYLTAG